MSGIQLKELKCPSCGAALRVDEHREQCTCNYCGHVFYIGAEPDEHHSSKPVRNIKGIPREYINALHEAYAYSTDQHMSKQDIYDALTDEEFGPGFPPEAAQYALDNMEVDWYQNALDMAKSYYFDDRLGFSKKEIYETLTDMEFGDKFPVEQAQYAMDHLDD